MTRVPYSQSIDENQNGAQVQTDANADGDTQRRKGCGCFAWGCLGIVLFVVAVLAAIPLVINPPGSGRDARKSEGEELMSYARNKIRAYYAKTETAPSTFSEANVPANDFSSEYYRVLDKIERLPDGRAVITAVPVDDPDRPTGRMFFRWESGQSRIEWSDD